MSDADSLAAEIGIDQLHVGLERQLSDAAAEFIGVKVKHERKAETIRHIVSALKGPLLGAALEKSFNSSLDPRSRHEATEPSGNTAVGDGGERSKKEEEKHEEERKALELRRAELICELTEFWKTGPEVIRRTIREGLERDLEVAMEKMGAGVVEDYHGTGKADAGGSVGGTSSVTRSGFRGVAADEVELLSRNIEEKENDNCTRRSGKETSEKEGVEKCAPCSDGDLFVSAEDLWRSAARNSAACASVMTSYSQEAEAHRWTAETLTSAAERLVTSGGTEQEEEEEERLLLTQLAHNRSSISMGGWKL